MKFSTCYFVRVMATAFVVLTLLSVPLFWLNFLIRTCLSELMTTNVRTVSIEPSGYLSPDIEEDPNLIQHSQVSARINQDYFMCLGIFDYILSRSPMGSRCDVFIYRSEENWAYFDRTSGQIICRYLQTESMPDSRSLSRQVQYHIGPDGISKIPDEALGRFIEPIIDSFWLNWGSKQSNPPDLIMYDSKLGQFFKVDFDRATVTKGPQINDTDSHQPIQIGWPGKNEYMLNLIWQAPIVDTSGNRIHGSSYRPQHGEIIQSTQYYPASPHVFVLDKTGRIDLLDKKTLEFTGTAGQLPQLRTLFESRRRTTPDNTLSYSASPLYLGQCLWPHDSENNDQPPLDPNSLRYAGIFAASLSRDGTVIAVTAFDKEGKVNELSYSRSVRSRGHSRSARNSSDEFYFGAPWTPVCSIGKYITESLHPPILSIASCFTASATEAGAGHRALFLLPNSFVAMNAMADHDSISTKIMITMLMMSPAIILAVCLAFCVSRDAVAVGFSKNLKSFWTIVTLAFGLAGYITYRLMRPTATLVTCPNCGKRRRPDMDTCHHCTAEWEIPELIPPTWRVLDS